MIGLNGQDGSFTWLQDDASCQLGSQVGLSTRATQVTWASQGMEAEFQERESVLTKVHSKSKISKDPSRGHKVSYNLVS